MTILVVIVISLWALFCTAAVLVVRGGTMKPKPTFSPEQIQWFRAAAKVAHRRHA